MRLAIMYLDKGGGISHCTYELAKVLADKAEVTCYIAAQNNMVDKFKALPCRVHIFEMQRGVLALVKAMLTQREKSGVAQAIKADAPDIVLDTGSWWWRSVVFRQLMGIMPIAEMHHDVTAHPGSAAWLCQLKDLLYPSTADIVISLSSYAHQELVRKYPHKKHIQSRHGIILAKTKIDTDAVVQSRQKLLFFGRIDAYKGIDILLNAYAAARESNPDLTLDIIGSGHITPDMHRKIAELGVGLVNRYVSDGDIEDAIATHGIVVLPYTSATQSGVAALALANGLPCVATDVGALPEQVINGVSGLIVPAADPHALASAMLTISGDPEVARRMSLGAVELGRDVYSWGRIGEQLLADIEKTLHS